jgi:hypothetical protein
MGSPSIARMKTIKEQAWPPHMQMGLWLDRSGGSVWSYQRGDPQHRGWELKAWDWRGSRGPEAGIADEEPVREQKRENSLAERDRRGVFKTKRRGLAQNVKVIHVESELGHISSPGLGFLSCQLSALIRTVRERLVLSDSREVPGKARRSPRFSGPQRLSICVQSAASGGRFRRPGTGHQQSPAPRPPLAHRGRRPRASGSRDAFRALGETNKTRSGGRATIEGRSATFLERPRRRRRAARTSGAGEARGEAGGGRGPR